MTEWFEILVDHAHESVTDEVREALWSRGASDEQIAQFKVGYLDGDLPPAEYPTPFLEWSGNGRKLAGCFLFPLTNTLGEVRGFQFRPVDRTKKEYMDFFLNRAEPVFFGLGQAMPSIWTTGEAVLVEGAFDFFPAQRVHPGTISTLTAKVSDVLLRTLHRLVRRLFLFYDGDQLGRRVSEKFLKEHGPEFDVLRAITYPFGVTLNGKPIKDPADLWEAWGDDRFNPYLKSQLE